MSNYHLVQIFSNLTNVYFSPVEYSIFPIIISMDATNKEIISVWIGKQSQTLSSNFYNLQAQQIFSQEEDPISQKSIWQNTNKMQPRALILETKIDRLCTLRQTNNQKIWEKFKQQDAVNSLMGMFMNIDAKPLKEHQQAEIVVDPLFSNWGDSEDNYLLIDQAFISIPTGTKSNTDVDLQCYQTFEEFYRINKERTEDRLRKQMERTDFLKVFTICSDQSYSGFTTKTIQFLREECPKKCYILTSLSPTNKLPSSSLPKLYDQVDIFLPISTSKLRHPYFSTKSQPSPGPQLAPLISTLLTPLILKDGDPYHYMSTIVNDNRRLFNAAFTLPVIDHDLNLHSATSIFSYEKAAAQLRNQIDKEKGKFDVFPKKVEEEEELRINFTNQSYLCIGDEKTKGKFLSQSYILKGNFNNLQKHFTPKSQQSNLSIKSLECIFSNPESVSISYPQFYQPFYKQEVQAYPFHAVMFSHQKFGVSLRQSLMQVKRTKIFNEEWPECCEKILTIADSYLELQQHDEQYD